MKLRDVVEEEILSQRFIILQDWFDVMKFKRVELGNATEF